MEWKIEWLLVQFITSALIRHYQFFPPLLFHHQSVCQHSEGRGRGCLSSIMKIIFILWTHTNPEGSRWPTNGDLLTTLRILSLGIWKLTEKLKNFKVLLNKEMLVTTVHYLKKIIRRSKIRHIFRRNSKILYNTSFSSKSLRFHLFFNIHAITDSKHTLSIYI